MALVSRVPFVSVNSGVGRWTPGAADMPQVGLCAEKPLASSAPTSLNRLVRSTQTAGAAELIWMPGWISCRYWLSLKWSCPCCVKAYGFISCPVDRSSLIFALEISRYIHLHSYADVHAFISKCIKISEYITACKIFKCLRSGCLHRVQVGRCRWPSSGCPDLILLYNVSFHKIPDTL